MNKEARKIMSRVIAMELVFSTGDMSGEEFLGHCEKAVDAANEALEKAGYHICLVP